MRKLLLVLALALPASADWLVAGPLPGHGRASLGADPALEQIFGQEQPRVPKEGNACGTVKWTVAKANDKGVVESEALAPGCAYTNLTADRDKVVLVSAGGAGSVIVNGEPFVGDVYGAGFVKVPVLLRKGDNAVFLRCARGWCSLAVEDPAGPLVLLPADATLPSIVDGVPAGAWGAIPVVNATNEWVRGATIEYGSVQAPMLPIPPLGVIKAVFLVGKKGPDVTVTVSWEGKSAEAKLTMKAVKGADAYARTFRSEIDLSVQFYGVRAPANPVKRKEYGLVLSLHGAGVGADGQAGAYPARDWCALAAPTNRRPFGFDWEDWGRLDALEVLAEAQELFNIDPSRVFLTGHSMGGHGTWQLAVQYPDRWAAAAPSAGWISLWTYPEAKPVDATPKNLMRLSAAPSDTLGLGRNLDGLPLFIIHGDADDNVPFGQAEQMAAFLKEFHKDYRLHVEKGAGHWWDGPAPGADCVSLPDLFDFFQRCRRPDALEAWEFRTYSPAVTARCRQAEIVAQEKPYVLSKIAVSLRVDEKGATTVIATENIAHFRWRAPGALEVDGFAVPEAKVREIWRAPGGKWQAGSPAGLRKTPDLQGPFAQACWRPFLMVVPTGGTPGEQQAALAKARYDSEVWWYRGNGRGPVVADTDVTDKHWKKYDLVLYGSAASNACWKKIADRLPVTCVDGEVTVNGETLKGDLAVAAVYPNPETPGKLVALVGASGPGGRRAWNAFGWWTTGSGTADVMVWTPEVFGKWTDAVKLIGFYGADWKPAEGFWKVAK